MTRDHFRLDGRRVLVTGGSRGLGRAMALGLAAAGAQVASVARSEVSDDETAVRNLVGDVSDADAVADIVDRTEQILGGTVDSVVHAAGVQHRAPAVDFPDDEWNRVLTTNLSAPFFLSREVGRRQVEAGLGGSHTFIASLTSTLGRPNMVAYGASKSGVLGVVRSLAVEWAPHGIRVNAIGPGYFRTALTEALFSDDVAREGLMQRIPQQRFGQPEDLAGALVFLTSPAASYVTGQLLMVDGGWTAA